MSTEREKQSGMQRRCGLYRTTAPLPGRGDKVPEGRLVYYHDHSQEGEPLILLPEANKDNRWSFQQRGYLVKDREYPATLEPLLAEGFYILRSTLRQGSSAIPARSLVQLGYNRNAVPILFVGRRVGIESQEVVYEIAA